MNRATRGSEVSAIGQVLYMALELSNKAWKVVFGDGARRRHVKVDAGDLWSLREAVAKAKERFRLPEEARVVSCYEAGWDGFWLHRYLRGIGIENEVVDSASIEVSRRNRRAKTDRLDGDKLLTQLMRYHAGEKCWSVVRVPSVEDEDARRLHRELERLKRERGGHRNRIGSLLVAQGLRLKVKRDFLTRLEAVKLWDGSPLPAELKAELMREYERLALLEQQIQALEAKQRERLRAPVTESERQVVRLIELGAIGPASGQVFVMEFFGWRGFRNRREVGSLAGLTGTPYNSGDSEHDQGISKAGNRRVRTMAIEIAWQWLRYQPNSRLSLWFKERFAGGGKRMRRIGIVALARKLLVALWRYLEDGVFPEGAVLIPSRV